MNRRPPPTAAMSALVLACGLTCQSAGQDAPPVALPRSFALTPQCELVFATVDECRATLTRPDRFTRELSRFDLESRLGRLDVTKQQYFEFLKQSALAWSPEEQRKVMAAAATVQQWIRRQDLPIPFPPRILLAQTSGREEGGAAYCRGAAIVLPRPMVSKSSALRLDQLLAHELFHVLSAGNEPLRRRLYTLIGFRPCPPLRLPESWQLRKLTNPDGPGLDYCIKLTVDEQPIRAVPLLYSKVDRFPPEQGGPFFRYMEFRLVALRPGGDEHSQCELVDGQPRMIPPSNPSFGQQIGANTKYILHPDEILADNFVFLLRGDDNLPTPRLVEQIRQTLLAPNEGK